MTYQTFAITGTYLREGYTRTQRAPLTVDGVEWLSYRTGISRYELVSADGKGTVRSNLHGSCYSAGAFGENLGKLFRSERSACEAVARAFKHRATSGGVR
jgi:hypothetical protein